MTSFLSKISRKKPFISSMGFVIVFVFAIMVPVESVISLVNDTQTNGYIIGTIQQTLVGVLVLWLWNNLDMDCKIGMQNGWKQAWLYWPLILIGILDFGEVLSRERILDWANPLKMIFYVLVYLSTGLIEEALCRGLILSILLSAWKEKKGGIYGAVIVSSHLFGFPHVVNYWIGKVSFTAMVATILYATMIGVYFAACVIRTDNLLLAVLVHGFVDITGSTREIEKGFQMLTSFYDVPIGIAVMQVLLAMPLLLGGLYLLRRCTCQNILCFEKMNTESVK